MSSPETSSESELNRARLELVRARQMHHDLNSALVMANVKLQAELLEQLGVLRNLRSEVDYLKVQLRRTRDRCTALELQKESLTSSNVP